MLFVKKTPLLCSQSLKTPTPSGRQEIFQGLKAVASPHASVLVGPAGLRPRTELAGLKWHSFSNVNDLRCTTRHLVASCLQVLATKTPQTILHYTNFTKDLTLALPLAAVDLSQANTRSRRMILASPLAEDILLASYAMALAPVRDAAVTWEMLCLTSACSNSE